MPFTKSSLAALVATLALSNASQYQLVEQHKGLSFFDGFDFFTDSDPTNGTVAYGSRAFAAANKHIGVVYNNNYNTNSTPSAYMGVDYTTITPNRPSVRLTSKQSYNHALVLIDVQHMPTGCGVWPALWMVGPNWPNSGEIDIIEQVILQLRHPKQQSQQRTLASLQRYTTHPRL
jgi:beta-glucanase (GH16 family)